MRAASSEKLPLNSSCVQKNADGLSDFGWRSLGEVLTEVIERCAAKPVAARQAQPDDPD